MKMRGVAPFAALALGCLLNLQGPAAVSKERENGGRYAVELGAVRLVPAAGLRSATPRDGRPFVAQFYAIPGRSGERALRNRGITLSRYLGGNAYLVRCRRGGCDALDQQRLVRATVELTPAMKRSRVFDSDPALIRRARSGEELKIHVEFSDHVPAERVRAILAEHRLRASPEDFGSRNSVRVEATWSELSSLLRLPEVEWVDPALPQPTPAANNAAERLHVDRVRGLPAFRGADGSGVHVAVVDNYPVDTHTDFEDRVTRVRVRPSIDHGTAMSGLIAGAGILDRRARGMAPRARLYWYSQVWDPWSEMRAGRKRYGHTIMSNSWGITVGWWFQLTGPDTPGHWSWRSDTWAWGYYHALSGATDAAIREIDLLAVFAAANQRERSFLGPHRHGDQYEREDGAVYEDVHPPNPEYRTISGHAIAKNVLTVGGTTKEDAMTHFSSWGPPDDGRVKPDVAATALEVYAPRRDDGYAYGSGTSNSTALVSGTAALLTDYYRRRHGADIGSALLKALLIHSARDLGPPGPDYVFGHGLVDAELAANVTRNAVRTRKKLRKKNRRGKPIDLMLERELHHRTKHAYPFLVPEGSNELRATLVWHDPAGPRLVNDLDLWVEDPEGRRHLPFVLDPESPAAPAVRQRNSVDNVERIPVPLPEPGVWEVVVRGRKVPLGPQRYALVVSSGEGNRPPRIRAEGACGIDTFLTTASWNDSRTLVAQSTFRTGDYLNFHMRPWITANGDYGDYFGSIRATFIARDASGRKILRDCYETHGDHLRDPRLGGIYQWTRFRIPSGLARGRYVAEGVLTMPNGCRRIARYPFTIE